MNYAESKNMSGMSVTRFLDVLGDVHTDVAGAAQILGCMATCAADGMTIEAQQLSVLSDSLDLCADALGCLLFNADTHTDNERLGESD